MTPTCEVDIGGNCENRPCGAPATCTVTVYDEPCFACDKHKDECIEEYPVCEVAPLETKGDET